MRARCRSKGWCRAASATFRSRDARTCDHRRRPPAQHIQTPLCSLSTKTKGLVRVWLSPRTGLHIRWRVMGQRRCGGVSASSRCCSRPESFCCAAVIWSLTWASSLRRAAAVERSFDGGVCLGDGFGDGLGMRDTLMTSRSRELDDMSSRSTGGRHRDAIVLDPSERRKSSRQGGV